jgi:CheY-like chemotaxis protein
MAVPDPTSLSKGKILVVDDDRLVLATVTHGLVQAGFEVIDADNGDDAILLARQHRPDLALLDIRMEGKSGFDVADYLRESLGTPFMFLSAFADAATVARSRSWARWPTWSSRWTSPDRADRGGRGGRGARRREREARPRWPAAGGPGRRRPRPGRRRWPAGRSIP